MKAIKSRIASLISGPKQNSCKNNGDGNSSARSSSNSSKRSNSNHSDNQSCSPKHSLSSQNSDCDDCSGSQSSNRSNRSSPLAPAMETLATLRDVAALLAARPLPDPSDAPKPKRSKRTTSLPTPVASTPLPNASAQSVPPSISPEQQQQQESQEQTPVPQQGEVSSSTGTSPALPEAPRPVDGLEIFCGHSPYDHLREIKLKDAPDHVVCVTYNQLSQLWQSQVYETRDVDAITQWLQQHNLERPALLFARVLTDHALAEKTAFSIECCESVTNLSSRHMAVLRAFTFALLQAGANVALADFALDVVNGLFQDKVPTPFRAVRQDVSGRVQLHFHKQTLIDAPNGQISMLGNLASEGHTSINTLGSTRRPVLRHDASSLSGLKVLAVATQAGRPLDDEFVYLNTATGEWSVQPLAGEHVTKGTPAVVIVDPDSDVYRRAEWRGQVLMFAAHFSEINNIGGVEETALDELVGQVGCESEVREYFSAKSRAGNDRERERVKQEWAYKCVQKAPQSKRKFVSSSTKEKFSK